MSENKRVVIVEDDPDMATLISHALRRDPRFEVVAVVATARAAVDTVRAVQPDLVVLDHYLEGGVMGLESAPVLKTVAPESKVIVFTTQDLGLEAYLEPEIDAYLQKDQLVHLLALAQRLLGMTTVT
jgi:two-component system, chemotaxis family, protein-glutamate methylesterase/glutaminase